MNAATDAANSPRHSLTQETILEKQKQKNNGHHHKPSLE